MLRLYMCIGPFIHNANHCVGMDVPDGNREGVEEGKGGPRSRNGERGKREKAGNA